MKDKQLKSEIRQNIRNKRQALSVSENTQSGILLNKQLEKNSLLSPHQHITCFLSFDGEVSTKHIIQSIWNDKKNCYLPELVLKNDSAPNHLKFSLYQQTSKLSNNQYGIPEIEGECAIKIEILELVLFPLVAFDLNGNRLGMGGGFYDATFASIRNKENRPKFIGLAHDFQLVENLPKEEWDLPLDGVCTPSRYFNFNLSY